MLACASSVETVSANSMTESPKAIAAEGSRPGSCRDMFGGCGGRGLIGLGDTDCARTSASRTPAFSARNGRGRISLAYWRTGCGPRAPRCGSPSPPDCWRSRVFPAYPSGRSSSGSRSECGPAARSGAQVSADPTVCPRRSSVRPACGVAGRRSAMGSASACVGCCTAPSCPAVRMPPCSCRCSGTYETRCMPTPGQSTGMGPCSDMSGGS